ncbi:hypothetical protein Taro_019306, partial [Colocasia esculenta]|nr:hypothetical protein [Colocasia esculenta]
VLKSKRTRQNTTQRHLTFLLTESRSSVGGGFYRKSCDLASGPAGGTWDRQNDNRGVEEFLVVGELHRHVLKTVTVSTPTADIHAGWVLTWGTLGFDLMDSLGGGGGCLPRSLPRHRLLFPSDIHKKRLEMVIFVGRCLSAHRWCFSTPEAELVSSRMCSLLLLLD